MPIFAHYLTTITMKFSTGYQQLTPLLVENSVYFKWLNKRMYVLSSLPYYASG